MNAGMTFKEKFKALTKNCEPVKPNNEELMKLNAYLKHILGDSIMQETKAIMTSRSSS